MKNLLPSDFMEVHPWNSVKQNSENESLACSIMKTKHFKGNTWDEVTYKDYLHFKKSRGIEPSDCATHSEFDDLKRFCVNVSTAVVFSPAWQKIVDANP
ncbi:MAG: hypothetical protein JWO03_910 [Bacteroidetes bacterium]|nr:hypothetical protein [Bacteroidota bacterium]